MALTRERADLYARITARTDAMLAAGWLAEVERLVRWGYTRECAAMNSLGYRELLAYMAGEMGWHETVAAIKKATCHLAKRQLTWFRKMAHVHWFNLSAMDEQTAVTTLVQHLQAGLWAEARLGEWRHTMWMLHGGISKPPLGAGGHCASYCVPYWSVCAAFLWLDVCDCAAGGYMVAPPGSQTPSSAA